MKLFLAFCIEVPDAKAASEAMGAFCERMPTDTLYCAHVVGTETDAYLKDPAGKWAAAGQATGLAFYKKLSGEAVADG